MIVLRKNEMLVHGISDGKHSFGILRKTYINRFYIIMLKKKKKISGGTAGSERQLYSGNITVDLISCLPTAKNRNLRGFISAVPDIEKP